MSVPAGLMQALQAGGAGASAGAPGGPAGGGPPPSPIQIGGDADSAGTGGMSDSDAPEEEHWLQIAKEALLKAEAADSDHSESAHIMKLIAAIQGLLGDRQKGSEAALGITPAMKAMKRSYPK